MGSLHRIQAELLADGKITEVEVDRLREFIQQNGQLDLEDVRLLVNLLSAAREVCPAFDNLFFPLLKEVILQDGRVGIDEQFYLLKMLYSDGNVREREKQFLRELRASARETSREFEELYSAAMN